MEDSNFLTLWHSQVSSFCLCKSFSDTQLTNYMYPDVTWQFLPLAKSKEGDQDAYESNIQSDDDLISPDLSPIIMENEEEHFMEEDVPFHLETQKPNKGETEGVSSCGSNTTTYPFHFIPDSFASADQITAFLVVEQPNSSRYHHYGEPTTSYGSDGMANLYQYLEKEGEGDDGPYFLVATHAKQLLKFQNGQLKSCYTLPEIAKSVYVCFFFFLIIIPFCLDIMMMSATGFPTSQMHRVHARVDDGNGVFAVHFWETSTAHLLSFDFSFLGGMF